jgi:hypothetical protein
MPGAHGKITMIAMTHGHTNSIRVTIRWNRLGSRWSTLSIMTENPLVLFDSEAKIGHLLDAYVR